MDACVFTPLCVCGVRGWLPACLRVRLVYRGCRVFSFRCVPKTPIDTYFIWNDVGYSVT